MMVPFKRILSRLLVGTGVVCFCLTASSYAQQKQAGSALDPDRKPSTSTGSSRGTNRGSSAPSSNGTYGMPSVNDAFKNLNNTVNEIFAERARAREARRQAQDEEDDSSRERSTTSERSTNSTAADREYSNRLAAERAAEDERVARDRGLTERLENERRLEAENDAIAAEMNKLAKNDEIDTEMRREEFAALVDEIVTHQSAADNPSQAEDSDLPVNVNQYDEIVDDASYRSVIDALKDNVSAIKETVSALSDSVRENTAALSNSVKQSIPVIKQSIPVMLADYGLRKASGLDNEVFDTSIDKGISAPVPPFGSSLNDKITGTLFGHGVEKLVNNFQKQYAEELQKREGADPNDEYEKNLNDIAISTHPISYLPRLVSSMMNRAVALRKQIFSVINKGVNNYGLAGDTTLEDK
jgi:hypothetical protein